MTLTSDKFSCALKFVANSIRKL